MQRQRDGQIDRYRQTDRQMDMQGQRDGLTQTTAADGQTYKDSQPASQTDNDRQTDRQTDRQADRYVDKQSHALFD